MTAPAATDRTAARPARDAARQSPWQRDRAPRLTAALVVVAGLLNLASALMPAQRERLGLLDDVVPGMVSRTATAVVAALGIGLLLLAGGLRRRHRVAWAITVAVLAGGAVLHVIKGLDVEEALAEAFVAGLLVGQAGQFPARIVRGERPGFAGSSVIVLAVTLAYGTAGLLVNDHDVRARLGVAGVVEAVARMALGFGPGVPLGGRFGALFPESVAAVFWVGALLVVARAFAPALIRRAVDPGLADAVTASGDSLAYFARRDDRATVRDGDVLVSYGTFGPVALAAGDPLGPAGQWPAAATAFLDAAADEGRIAAVLGCGQDAAAVWRAAGMATIYLGDEAVLDLDRFTLDGPAVKKARQSWNRAGRAGWTTLVARTADLGDDDVIALADLSRRWRGEAAERGFSMALGRLFDPRDPGALVVAARDGDGVLRGFLHLVPWGADGASLDVMRRDREAPSWLNDYLIVEAARRLPDLGVHRVSLNFSFLRALLEAGTGKDVPKRLRLARWLLHRLSRPFQIETLYRFNRKFDPDWQPRYLAVEAPEELPRIALAVLRAEGLVQLSWRLRLPGRGKAATVDATTEAPANDAPGPAAPLPLPAAVPAPQTKPSERPAATPAAAPDEVPAAAPAASAQPSRGRDGLPGGDRDGSGGPGPVVESARARRRRKQAEQAEQAAVGRTRS